MVDMARPAGRNSAISPRVAPARMCRKNEPGAFAPRSIGGAAQVMTGPFRLRAATDGKAMADDPDSGQTITVKPYEAPSGGWGSVKSLADILPREESLLRTGTALLLQNKPDGFMCASCAWAKPAKPHTFEFCENGAKATAWEMTPKTVGAGLLRAAHRHRTAAAGATTTSRRPGRLTHPMRWDPATRQLRAGRLGGGLRRDRPRAAGGSTRSAWCSTPRAAPRWRPPTCTSCSARMYGTNNLPDSSNMCHESTSVALPETIGVPVGTVHARRFRADRLHLLLRPERRHQQPAHAAPAAGRAASAACRSSPSIRCASAGCESFANPQSPAEMLTGDVDPHQHAIPSGQGRRRHRGDHRACARRCIAADDAAQAGGRRRACSTRPSSTSTRTASTNSRPRCARYDWARDRAPVRPDRARRIEAAAARLHALRTAVIGIYGMGLTQHRDGRRERARCWSTCCCCAAISASPAPASARCAATPTCRASAPSASPKSPSWCRSTSLRELYGFEPPREKGLNTVEACEGILDGRGQGLHRPGRQFRARGPGDRCRWSRPGASCA